MKKSILGLFVLSGLLMADFVRDDVKEVVNDTTTCLMWQDDNASKSVRKTWQEAIDYCEDMSFAGYDDWRLPNINELYSIADRSKSFPAIKDAFENVSSSEYWSSTTVVINTSGAWNVCFIGGHDRFYDKTENFYVRCVRSGR
jgi:hypothetical protein